MAVSSEHTQTGTTQTYLEYKGKFRARPHPEAQLQFQSRSLLLGVEPFAPPKLT